jgi:hypothetical protein
MVSAVEMFASYDDDVQDSNDMDKMVDEYTGSSVAG